MRENHFFLINLKEEEKRPLSKEPFGPPIFKPIEFEVALEMAQSWYPQYPIVHAWDLGSRWLFSYNTGDPPLPGIHSCCINKNTSKIEYYFPPKYKGVEPTDDNRIF